MLEGCGHCTAQELTKNCCWNIFSSQMGVCATFPNCQTGAKSWSKAARSLQNQSWSKAARLCCNDLPFHSMKLARQSIWPRSSTMIWWNACGGFVVQQLLQNGNGSSRRVVLNLSPGRSFVCQCRRHRWSWHLAADVLASNFQVGPSRLGAWLSGPGG